MSCVSSNTVIKLPDWVISKNGAGVFIINSSIESIPNKYFIEIKDTVKYDEDAEYIGKCFKINENEFYIAWFSDDGKKEIYELTTNAKNAKTKKGIGIGSTIDMFYKEKSAKYFVFDDFGELVLIDRNEHIRFHFNNYDLLDTDEINGLYKNELNIDDKKVKQIKVKQIDVISFEEDAQ